MGPLRGRDRECAELGQLVTSAAGGAGGVVVVVGAAGIGKSRLLAEAARIAGDQGVKVATGVADELDQVTPWAPLLRALQSTAPVVLGEADLAPLRGLLDQRLAVIECIRAALERASRRQPLLITLDDLQWADPATLQALGTLPVQLFSYPIAWILASRKVPSSRHLQGLMARLDDAGATPLRLTPLDADAAGALAADVLGRCPDAAVADLVRRADGNPFYIVELMRAAGEALVPRADGGMAGRSPGVPASLGSAVEAQLRSLRKPARTLLKVASVLGREFTVTELEAITGQPASQLLPGVEQALLAEVLTEQGVRLAFRHDLLREAVYQRLPAALRQALHRDAAAALRRLGAPLVRVAGQYAAGAQPGDEEAIEVLTAAIGDLFSTAPSAAADLALRILDLLGDDDQRRPATIAMAVGLLGWASRLDEARDLGERYLAEHDLPPALEAEIEVGMRRAWAMSTSVPYPKPLPAHLITPPAVPARVRAHLIAYDQIGALWSTPPQQADRALRQATELLTEDDDIDLADVLAIRVALAHRQGQLLAALGTARSGLDAGQRSQHAQATAIRESTTASCIGALGRPGAALEKVDKALQAASATGYTFIVSRCLSLRSLLLLELGRVEDARAEARSAASLAWDLSLHYYLGQAVTSLVETAIRQGDLDEAKAAASRLAQFSHPELQPGDPYWASALCADATGRPDLALVALEPVMRRLSQGQFLFSAWYPSRLPQIAGLAVRAGSHEQAEIVVTAAAVMAERNPGVVPLLGAAAHARGLWQSDTGALLDAVELFSRGERPLATAAAQEDLGRAIAQAGQKDDAVAALEAAYTTYLAANATRDLARVRGALHALGVRKRRAAVARPEHGWESLTSGELAVVEVVAQGLTNREAAARLYLSADTINTHLRHAFAKLGIRSRVELTRLVVERERSHTPT